MKNLFSKLIEKFNKKVTFSGYESKEKKDDLFKNGVVMFCDPIIPEEAFKEEKTIDKFISKIKNIF